MELIQKHIGFSKDFNLFELTDLASFNIKYFAILQNTPSCCGYWAFVWFFTAYEMAFLCKRFGPQLPRLGIIHNKHDFKGLA